MAKRKTGRTVLVKANLTPETHRRLIAYSKIRGERVSATVEYVLSTFLPSMADPHKGLTRQTFQNLAGKFIDESKASSE